MAENSAIEWTRHSWSPWLGCQKVSPACDGCYAEHLMDTRLGRVEWGPAGKRVRTSAPYWRQPLAWNRACAAAGRRDTVFPSLCDPFDNRADPQVRRDFLALMRDTPNLTWLLLTKRPQNIEAMVEEVGFMPPNAAFGATCEDQRRLELNVLPLLDAAHALKPAFTFLSCEPLLERIDLRRIKVAPGIYLDALTGGFTAEASFSGGLVNYQAGLDALPPLPERRPRIGWIITGGETDQGRHKARPTHPDWFRAARDACAATRTPYLHKQNGEWAPSSHGLDVAQRSSEELIWRHGEWSGHMSDRQACLSNTMNRVGKKLSGRLLDGVEHNGMPEVAHG